MKYLIAKFKAADKGLLVEGVFWGIVAAVILVGGMLVLGDFLHGALHL